MDSFEEELQALTSKELYDKGMDYFYGRAGVRKDYEKALRCFIKALDFGNAVAMEQIGYMYDSGCGVREDRTEALKWYRRAAEIGDVNLENHFAYCLKDGYGIEQNIDEAIKWFWKSAELGNKKAMYELAILFVNNGHETEAIRLFQKSSELGHKDAMFELAALLVNRNKNETKAMEWLIKYNNGNELAARVRLADLYYCENPKRAFAIYKEAAEQGENCYYTLGEMYLKGKGIEKDVCEAIKWFEKAAQIEDISNASDEYCKWDSMLKIAEIYIGLKDEESALEWLTKRNDGNRLQGMGELAHIYYGDDDFEYEDTSLIDKEKAFEWFEKLYEMKDTHGTYYFAEMWEPKSRSKALQIYKDGVEFGSERCCKRIIQLYLEEGNIPEAARWSVKYFDMADEELCKNLCRNPFKELKQIANFFIATPPEELIRIYDDDSTLAAEEIYKFGCACGKTLVNLYTKLEIMSIVTDLQGDSCPRELLETLFDRYEKVYQAVESNGVSDEIEGDEYELRLKKLLDPWESSPKEDSKTTEKIYHGADYYKEKFLYFKSKLEHRLPE